MVASKLLIQISASQISRVFIRRFYMQDQSTSMDIHIFFHILLLKVSKWIKSMIFGKTKLYWKVKITTNNCLIHVYKKA